MSEYKRAQARDFHERAFRALLRLLPPSFNEEFGDAMLEFFRDRMHDARANHGANGVAGVWMASSIDLVRQIPLAWWDAACGIAHRVRARFAGRAPNDLLHISRRRDWMLSSILQDVRYALRGIVRTPGFSLVVICTLALGLGANVAIYSVVRGVLLKPLPYEHPEELVAISHLDPYGNTSEGEFADYRREAKSLAALGAANIGTSSLTGAGGDAERIEMAAVSDGFFGVGRTNALVGRTFTPDEEKPGASPVAILSYELWQRRYGGDRAVIGRNVSVDGVMRSVVGVMPPRYELPRERIDVWAPLKLRYDSLWGRNNHYLDMVGRLAPNVSVDRSNRELSALALRFTKDFPETYAADQPLRPHIVPMSTAVVGSARPYLLALVGAVGFVLAIACVNVAGLLLARGEARRKELAIRTAMGASRVRLVRQVLTESALHTLAGASLGIVLAWGSIRLLRAFAPADLPRVSEIGIDGGVLLFALFAAIVTGFAFGAWPALRSSRDDSVETLKEGGKGSSGASRDAASARRRLVMAEMAIAVITLTGAGVMLRSLWALQGVELGFQPEGALSMQVALPPKAYKGERSVAFYRNVMERVRAMPGMTHVGAVQDLPMGGGFSTLSILLDNAPPTSTALAPTATPMIVTPDYFGAMSIQLVRGRLLSDADDAGTPLVVVVNEAMVRKHWANRDPLGATVRMLGIDGAWATVVGVVRDVRLGNFSEEMRPMLYYPHAQAAISAYYAPTRMNLVIRSSNDPRSLAAPVSALIRSMEPDAPIARVQPMTRVVAAKVETRRFVTQLLAGFAALALGLAALGLYGVVSYSVVQRQQELGVRLALGARRSQVLSLVLAEGVRTALVGGVIGVAGALALVRVLRSLVADVVAWDPLTLGVVVAILVVVAVIASYLPARRASRIDPMPALRAQ